MLGRKELQETLAQKEGLLAQREAEIGVLTKRVEELTGREKQMQAELAAYRERGNAIVNALTDAQQAASRIREEAERQKAQIIASAYADRDAARKEADTVLQNAREQAAQIVARSEEEAARRRSQADAYVAELEGKGGCLREYLRKTAEEAHKQADIFAAIMGDMAGVQAENLPEEYDSPAALMQSIYSIQGRSLPREETGKEPEPAPMLDLDALIAKTVEEAAEEEAPQAAEAAGEPEAAQEDEDQVVTVDSVLTGSASGEKTEDNPSVGAPDGLDAILDDILKDL